MPISIDPGNCTKRFFTPAGSLSERDRRASQEKISFQEPPESGCDRHHLCAQLFDWAHFCRTKRQTASTLGGYLPVFAHITEAATADITVARTTFGRPLRLRSRLPRLNWYADLTRMALLCDPSQRPCRLRSSRPPASHRRVRDGDFLSRTGRPEKPVSCAWSKSKSALWPPRFFDESPRKPLPQSTRSAGKSSFQGPQGQDLSAPRPTPSPKFGQPLC